MPDLKTLAGVPINLDVFRIDDKDRLEKKDMDAIVQLFIKYRDDIRKEAKKWVKEIEEHGAQISRDLKIYSMTNWIEFFFNIKEE